LDISDLKSGITIVGPKWPEPVNIKKIETPGSYVRIVGSTTLSNEHIDQIIPKSDLTNIDIQTILTDFKSKAWKVFLALETKRYRFASLYDPLLAMNTSKVDPLPHQIEAVYGYVLKMPRIRFLLAHDPGAGKTIMAGLIIKELKMRKVVKRILIVVPGHLKDQWRRELKDRFEETFVVVNRGYLGAHYAENVWEKENQIITSIDFAKQEEVLPSLDSSEFDMIIVDEAHKMSAYRYGDKTEKTGRYRLGEILSRISEHFLFLTATPHKGDPENFRLFLDLLEPGFFATSEMLKESIENHDNPLFLRRIKEDMKDFEGKPLFVPRNVLTPDIRLSDPEKELYNEVSLYVKEQFNKALTSDKKRNVGFALLILQRRMASSTFALLKSLERRKQKLEDMREMVDNKNSPTTPHSFDFEETEDMSEEERWKEEELWETLSVAENREELEKEIRTLSELILKAKEVINLETESKLLNLKYTLTDFKQSRPNEKILIFTESKDTLEYLVKKIISWGYSVNTIHGGMQLEERVEAEKIFKNQSQIMVATEAAGEGINLQFCHLMINYDLPWNPNRLEQRMGRVHRYGQQFEVFVFNLVASDTREGQILIRLFQKLNEIKSIMNSDKVFDVISEILHGKNLAQLLLDAASNARDQEEILKELDFKVDEQYISEIRENLGESLATKYMDYTRLKEMRAKARENRLIPEYTEALFKKAFSNAGGRFHDRTDKFIAIDSIPYEIKSIANEDNFKKSFGALLKTYPKTTFDKEIGFKHPDAEFITFGHPIFESTLEWIDRQFGSEPQKGAVFIDPDAKLNGYIIFHEGAIKDGTGEIAGKKLFAHYVDNNLNIQQISPTIIWDLIESDEKNNDAVELENIKDKVLSEVIQSLESYSTILQKERNRQSEIKQKYGVQSLKKLIVDLDNDLVELQIRKDTGENVDLAIRNKENRKRKYEDNETELESLIQKEQSLTMNMPSFFGIVKVNPSVTIQNEMHRDPAVEEAGMKSSMQYERDAGRIPEDVSKENLGFDVRSVDDNGDFRYIEVKSRAGVGSVALTTNEWFKAQHLGDDFYLYVVWNAVQDPNSKPLIIRNPAKNLSVSQEIVRYFVYPEEIREKAE
jgi:SNF2 family DNA or RNA helicase